MQPEIKIVEGIRNAPIFSLLKERFPLDEEKVVITYGDSIFLNHKDALTQDLFVHESVHCKQQGYNDADASNWWGCYLSQKSFRLSEEIEAYRAQYAFLKKHIKNRNRLFGELRRLAKDLSGHVYGNIIGFLTAMQEIRKG